MLQLLVFIWGWTPILGKLISVQALQLVWFRILLAIIAIAAYMWLMRHRFKVKTLDILRMSGVGAIIALHWVAFYHAIKVANVAICLAAFSMGTLFTAILEPLFYKRSVAIYELLFGLIIIAAITAIFKVEMRYATGIFFGILGAFTSSLFTVLNGLLVRRLEPQLISFYELSGGFVVLSLYLLISGEFDTKFFILSNSDWGWLLILGVGATAFPFIVSTGLLKKLNPYTVSLSLNLETVYGIVFAYLIWRREEQMTIEFYLATAVILLVIVVNGLLKGRKT